MQSYFPFDSGQGANITETLWTKMAQHWLSTGIIRSVLSELQVFGDSTGMQAKVRTGAAWIKGHYYESDAEETLPIGSSNASNPRIDRIIIRLDWTENTVQLAVLQGVATSSPVPPALTQNSSRWEISLAQIRVNANVTTIAAANVTDERTYTDVYSKKPTASLGLNGWFKDDTTGLIFQWGSIQVSPSTGGTVTFPIAFPNQQLVVIPAISDAFYADVIIPTTSKSNFQIKQSYSSALYVFWFAIGY